MDNDDSATWIKVKNRAYSQSKGRQELFEPSRRQYRLERAAGREVNHVRGVEVAATKDISSLSEHWPAEYTFVRISGMKEKRSELDRPWGYSQTEI